VAIQSVIGVRNVAAWPVIEAGKVTAAFKQVRHRFFHDLSHGRLIKGQCGRVNPANQGDFRPESTTKSGIRHTGTADVAYPTEWCVSRLNCAETDVCRGKQENLGSKTDY
jgi:hypothetical protein